MPHIIIRRLLCSQPDRYHGYWNLILHQSHTANKGSASIANYYNAPLDLTEMVQPTKVPQQLDFASLKIIYNMQQWQQRMDQLKKPTPPTEFDCCQSGCAVCVWDIYQEGFDYYDFEKKRLFEYRKI